MNQSFYMHSRYDEFKEFLNTVNSDARINPNALNLAFDVWLDSQTQQFFDDRPPLKTDLINENTILRAKADAFLKSCKAYEESNDILKADLDRLHRERDNFQQQCSAMAEENERLHDELTRIKSAINKFLYGDAVGERGHACMSIDGGNL